jgi:hypothetical protein
VCMCVCVRVRARAVWGGAVPSKRKEGGIVGTKMWKTTAMWN